MIVQGDVFLRLLINNTNYPHQYGSYSHDPSSGYSSSNVAAASAAMGDYYSQIEATCAPDAPEE